MSAMRRMGRLSDDRGVAALHRLAADGQELLSVLEAERDALLGRDPAALEAIVAQKLALLTAIEGLLKSTVAPDSETRPHDGDLHKRVDEILEEAVRRNDLNGRIAAQREIGVRQALDVLTGRAAAPPLYGPAGRASARRGGQAIGIA
jgi:flagellar biosynthesis/type III secretory pathway chaperone